MLKGVLSPMNSMLGLNCRYDFEMNKNDFGALLMIGLTWAAYFSNASVVPLCRLQILLLLFTARQECA